MRICPGHQSIYRGLSISFCFVFLKGSISFCWMRESNGAFVGGSFVEWISDAQKVKLYVPNFFSQILKQTNLVGFAFF
jgi:hypothetical protein